MQRRHAVLLLHGLWMGPWVMSWLAHALNRDGYEARALALHSMSDKPSNHVEKLAAAVNDMDADVVHLVGHSMGGVVVLRYLQEAAKHRLGRALLLGAPALGSHAARQMDRQPWGGLLGASRELWLSPFEDAVPAGIEVGAIAGNVAFGLGPLFVSLEGDNDGVVTVAETRVEGLSDHIVLHVSHSAMLISGEVARQSAAFLGTGRFVR